MARTSITQITLALLAVLTLAAADKAFQAKPAHKYPANQGQGDVTVAVKPYHDDKLMAEAFGKAQPYKYGFLPVLVVITNDSEEVISLENLEARYISGGRQGIESLSAADLATFNPKGHQPKSRSIPGVWNRMPKAKKGPLAKPELALREFNAPVLPPGSSASGFFYFDVGLGESPTDGASMYLTGLRNLSTGRELFYFEIGLDRYK